MLGGTSGIGAEVVRRARFDPKRDFSSGIQEYGLEDFDVRDGYPVHVVERMSRASDIVYSIGINALDWIKDLKPQDFRLLMDVNVYGFLDLLKELKAVGWTGGSIVVVTSDAAVRPMRTSAAYCASKAALEMAVRVAARELAVDSYAINGVAPGKVADTAMTAYVDARVLELRGWTEEQATAYENASSLRRGPLYPQEVANVILDVLDYGQAGSMIGNIVTVNGGR